jgi:hypothetical protein
MARFERGDKVVSWGRHKATVLEMPDDVVIRVLYADGWTGLSNAGDWAKLPKA